MTDRPGSGQIDSDLDNAYKQLNIWDVEDQARFDLNTSRQSYNLPLANALIEFDPFYCPPAQESIKPTKRSITPIVNLPPPRPASGRPLRSPQANKDENVKGFVRPRATVSTEQPKFQIPARLLQDKDMYAVIPVELRGTQQAENRIKGTFDRMMQALDESRRDLISHDGNPTGSDAKHPVQDQPFQITPVKQVSRFGATTSKITSPPRDWIPDVPEAPQETFPTQPLSFVTPTKNTSSRQLPPHMKMPDTPESPLAKKSQRVLSPELSSDEDDSPYDRAVQVIQQAIHGKTIPAGSTKYLLITGIDRIIRPEVLRERIAVIADIKALVYRHQDALGAIAVLFHSATDAGKVATAVSSGKMDLRTEESASDHGLLPSGMVLSPQGNDNEAACHALSAGAVLQFAGKGVKRYLADCEACLKIQVESDTIDGTAEFLQLLLEEVGPLRLFAPDETRQQTFIASFEDERDTAQVASDLPKLDLDGYRFTVSGHPMPHLENANPSPEPIIKSFAPITPPDSSKNSRTWSPSYARRSGPISPTPWRSPANYQLPVTPPRNNALERLLQATPTADLLAAVRNERKKWDEYELALVSTPLSGKHMKIFRGGQVDSPSSSTKSPGNIPLSASKLVSFNSMKSPGNVRRDEWFGTPFKPKGQDSIRYRQEVPQEYRFSLERLQRGLDSRTTVMIKDIPNKLSRNQLIDAIHEVVPGGITFLYLRHDWEHCCNVGYGFVNFRTLYHLEEFARQRLGQKWALYMSDKELQLSYATIQGHEALVAHFRNSTVMHANPEWRPVVFDTAGEIEHFPPPNRQHNSYTGSPSAPRTATYDWEDVDLYSL